MFREQPEVAKADRCGHHTGVVYGIDMMTKFFKDAKESFHV
jgi:hypothetical protein